jgi:glycerol-3-phosphate dehydrogenase
MIARAPERRPSIPREPSAAERRRFDLIVVGGGIQGATIALEASRRGVTCLLLERGDYGSGASAASLRILHGGVRQLQRLQPARAWRSLRARAWFLRRYPELVAPLPCLFPLDGHGLRRPTCARAALAAHALLARLAGVGRDLPGGRVLSAPRARELLGGLRLDDLAGAALWHDAIMLDPVGIVLETVRSGCAQGLVALDHVHAEALLVDGGRVCGVHARDGLSGETLRFQADRVVEATGPGTGMGGTPRAGAVPALVAFNLLLDRPPPGPCAFAAPGSAAVGRALVLVPCDRRVLAGTWYIGDDGPSDPARLAEPHLDALLAELGRIWPAARIDRRAVLGVLAGRLPAAASGSERPRESDLIRDFARSGGPMGYVRVCGTKFTTAPDLARRVVMRLFPDARPTARTAGTVRPDASVGMDRPTADGNGRGPAPSAGHGLLRTAAGGQGSYVRHGSRKVRSDER